MTETPRHAKKFTGVPRTLLDRERVYLLGWVGSRWEVIAESARMDDGVSGGDPDDSWSDDSRDEAFGVSWLPITPEQIRDRAQRASALPL